ncbi:hypothetical protein L2E82_32930 [Cichorium intybus]|uniref:Uncharacterized protein n=1 Tax=Cichorium intybus TaxID=13427 RepID=A0ACB9BI62_CICIN|nr:hypothetical protein L2E82_32930 [Cichorium intybus]
MLTRQRFHGTGLDKELEETSSLSVTLNLSLAFVVEFWQENCSRETYIRVLEASYSFTNPFGKSIVHWTQFRKLRRRKNFAVKIYNEKIVPKLMEELVMSGSVPNIKNYGGQKPKEVDCFTLHNGR